MKHTVYRLLFFSVMVIVLSGPAMLTAAQDGMPQTGRMLNMPCSTEVELANLLDALRDGHPGHDNPPITGLRWHRNELFSFFVPLGWQKSDRDDSRVGVVYYPEPDDPQTHFTVEVRDLGMAISPEDIDGLDAEFIDAIEQLPEGEIDSHETTIVGEQVRLDYRYTFREDCVIRRRWVRVFYLGTRETMMMAQGSTLDLYDYWLPWFFEAMSTAQVHDHNPTIELLESLN